MVDAGRLPSIGSHLIPSDSIGFHLIPSEFARRSSRRLGGHHRRAAEANPWDDEFRERTTLAYGKLVSVLGQRESRRVEGAPAADAGATA